MNDKKTVIFGLLGLIACVSNADINLKHTDEKMLVADVSFSELNSGKPKYPPKPKSTLLKPGIGSQRTQQYELDGYINKKYVRVVLEKQNHKDKYVVGNIYDKSGKGTYIHGEYVDGALHVYDRKGTHFTIVVDKK